VSYYETCRDLVRAVHPDAEVRPTALMYVVMVGDREIGQRTTDPMRAWSSALDVVRANERPKP